MARVIRAGTEMSFRSHLRPGDSSEHVLGQARTLLLAFDWSADGREVIGTALRNRTFSLVAWPLAAAPHAEMHARTILRDPGYSLWNGRYSADRRWLSFNANGPPISVIGVAAAEGDVTRPWVRITSDTEWSDQPRWSADGEMLYYVSGFRELLPNVWAVPFDRERGGPNGPARQVTAFDNPARGFTQDVDLGPIGVGKGRLTVPIAEGVGQCLDDRQCRPVTYQIPTDSRGP
jgi:WD40-like Beta Propeller Repeat